VGAGGQPNAVVRADGTFQLGPLFGARRFRAGTSPGWTLKSIVVNGQDVTDTPLTFGSPSQSLRDVDITFTDQITTLTGTIRAPSLKAALVVVFSDERDRWFGNSRFVVARQSSMDGSFAIQGLPAGGYFVVALDKLPEGATPADIASDSEFLDRLSRDAHHVALTERATATVALQLTTIQ
jgi:hypothetical protein